MQPLIWGERERWLEKVALLSDRCNVVIATNVFGEDYVRLMNRAKIVFNYSVDGATNARVYEAAACGALLFNEAKNAEVAAIFEDSVHHVAFSPANWLERIEKFLSDDEARQRIADAGRHVILSEHSLFQHTNDLYEQCEKFAAKGVRYRPSASKDDWERNYRKAQQAFGCFLPPYVDHTRKLLEQSRTSQDLLVGWYHEAQAALLGWEVD